MDLTVSMVYQGCHLLPLIVMPYPTPLIPGYYFNRKKKQHPKKNISVKEKAGNSNGSATVEELTCHWDGKMLLQPRLFLVVDTD